jgi:hypothetical protein
VPHAVVQGRFRLQADFQQLPARTFALLVGSIPKLLDELLGRGSRGSHCGFFGPRHRGDPTPRSEGQDPGKTARWVEHQADSVGRLVAAAKAEKTKSHLAHRFGCLPSYGRTLDSDRTYNDSSERCFDRLAFLQDLPTLPAWLPAVAVSLTPCCDLLSARATAGESSTVSPRYIDFDPAPSISAASGERVESAGSVMELAVVVPSTNRLAISGESSTVNARRSKNDLY